MEGVKENIKVKDIDTIEKISGESLDIVKENVSKIKELFPEVFCEDKIDFERLEEVLGNYIEDKEERYRFEWHGKSKAIRMAQTPSRGTLRPCIEESKNWDTTKNLYIEGDNLEVLKLLQKSYQNKVKMIYIDPPYNTGNDFVYKDDYKDNLKNYFEVTGQIDEEGNKVSTNSEGGGRYHTNWLNMMYPRLRLARNLLKDDGVIFINIDDNETENLKKICNEIFGEENFITNFLWKKKSTSTNTVNAKVSSLTDYILVYGKRYSTYNIKPRITSKETRTYNFCDSIGKYRTTIIEKKDSGDYKRDTMKYKILGYNPREGKRWQIGEAKARELESNNRFLIDATGVIKLKIYDFEDKDTTSAHPNLLDNHGTTDSAAKHVNNNLFGAEELFSNPKPIELLRYIIDISTNEESIVLDFFSGSSTTAEAIMKINSELSGQRKFIMVQLPENTCEKSEAYKAGYKNICEIGKERIRRAGDEIVGENIDKEGIDCLDIGFKVFKLDSSNIKPWNPDYDNIKMSLEDTIDNFVPARTEEDVIYEIMLKYGVDLIYPIETREFKGKKVFSIGFGALIICLNDEINLDIVQAMVDLKKELNPHVTRFVFKDNGFKTDSVKTNTIEILKRNNIKEIISI